jgi:hypothetical protein
MLGVGVGLGLRGTGIRREQKNYDPLAALGTDIYEYWDTNRADTISETTDATYSNAVSAWLGLVTGANLAQSTPNLKPTYSPTAFAGAPCIVLDGIQQYLTCTDAALLALLPSGASPCEIWALLSQDALPADTTERYAVGYSGTSVTTGRAISRYVNAGVNRARGRTGTGAAATSVNDAAVDFSGIHVIRQIVGATQSSLSVDGGALTNGAVVPSTTNSRFRVGAISASGPSNYWQGKVAAVLITKPLSDDKAADLHRYLG